MGSVWEKLVGLARMGIWAGVIRLWVARAIPQPTSWTNVPSAASQMQQAVPHFLELLTKRACLLPAAESSVGQAWRPSSGHAHGLPFLQRRTTQLILEEGASGTTAPFNSALRKGPRALLQAAHSPPLQRKLSAFYGRTRRRWPPR